jgi:hypothetical protein
MEDGPSGAGGSFVRGGRARLYRLVGYGFDIHKKDPTPGDDGDFNSNHISVHFDKVEKQEFDVTEFLDLARGEWIHARIIMRPGGSFQDVSVILTPRGGRAAVIVNKFRVDGFNPYHGRVYFGGRSGGESARHDLDNVNVQFLSQSQAVVSLSHVVRRSEGRGARRDPSVA